MPKKYQKFILIIFLLCLIGAGIFCFLNIQKKESAQTKTTPNLKLLTSHSSPQTGENWVVSFETTGTSDLTITPKDPDTIGDLDFVSLKCGEEERTPQILENDAIFYPNWSCDGTGEITHLVNVAKNHVLKSQFGHQIAYAYNSPGVVPQGTIAIWSGTLASIPANWYLCDGNNGTPNLVAKFVRGAPAATDPGTTGGSDTHTHTTTAAGTHTHSLGTNATHQHTTASAGSHSHGLSVDHEGGGSGSVIMRGSAGSHTHTVNANSAGHSHTSGTDANHTHTINACADNRPPFYEVAYIQAGAGAEIAVGIIIIWTGTVASIPSGWALCDGGGGRPDFRDRFLRGINTSTTEPLTNHGELTTHTHTVVARDHTHTASDSAGAHTHTFPPYSTSHSHNLSSNTMIDNSRQTDPGTGFNHTHDTTDSVGNTTHTLATGGSHTHTLDAGSNLNIPYHYLVAYIISTSAISMPTNGIIIWTGTLATIPSGYSLCDGIGDNPELRSYFLRGAGAGVDPGVPAVQGSDTHLHTETGTAGSHNDHAVNLDAGHTHTSLADKGAHTHSLELYGGYSGTYHISLNNIDGGHHHDFALAQHNDHSLGSATGAHDHEPWANADTRPAYYEVAFISAPESNAAPTVSDVSLNGGNSITLSENTTKSVSATGTVSDTNGYANISSVIGKIYRSGVGSDCSADNNNCYSAASCATSSCASNDCVATCSYNVQFYADPTDTGKYASSSGWTSQSWVAWIKAIDASNASSSATNISETVDINTLPAVIVTNSITYDSLSPEQNMANLTKEVTATTTGNVPIDVQLKGDDMTYGATGTIAVANQKYATSAVAWASGTSLTANYVNLEVDLPRYGSSATSSEILRPNAAGDETQAGWSQNPEGVAHWTLVDEAVADDDSWIGNTDTTYMRELYNLPSHSSGSGTINSIKIYFRVMTGWEDTSFKCAKPSQKSGTTVTDGDEVDVPANAIWQTFSQTYTTNPATGNPYIWDEIDALQVGISLKSPDGASVGFLSQIYVEVNYTPSNQDTIYWGWAVPSGTPVGTYTGTDSFNPVSD